MIKVQYDINKKSVIGYYPNHVAYPHNTIDTALKIIDDLPYIEITESEYDANLDKKMVVIDNIYQEYSESEPELLQKAKDDKIAELIKYHNSDKVKLLTINGSDELLMTLESRNIIKEKLTNLDNKIILGSESTIKTKLTYINGNGIDLTLIQIRELFKYIMNIRDPNHETYKNHYKTIKALTTPEEIDDYDFTLSYLTNNTYDII